MKKTKVLNKFRRKTRHNRRKTRKYLKKNRRTLKGGTIDISNYETMKDKKQKLEDSFQHFDNAKNEILKVLHTDDTWKNYQTILTRLLYSSRTLPFGFNVTLRAIDGILLACITNFSRDFNKMFEELKKQKIINGCNDNNCQQSWTMEYTRFKIRFVFGFIIAYYYRNPTKFIDDKYLKSFTSGSWVLGLVSPFVSHLIYLGTHPAEFAICNPISQHLLKVQYSNFCPVIEELEAFIRENEFNVSENEVITEHIFNFINAIKRKSYGTLEYFVPFINTLFNDSLNPHKIEDIFYTFYNDNSDNETEEIDM